MNDTITIPRDLAERAVNNWASLRDELYEPIRSQLARQQEEKRGPEGEFYLEYEVGCDEYMVLFGKTPTNYKNSATEKLNSMLSELNRLSQRFPKE